MNASQQMLVATPSALVDSRFHGPHKWENWYNFTFNCLIKYLTTAQNYDLLRRCEYKYTGCCFDENDGQGEPTERSVLPSPPVPQSPTFPSKY